MIGLGGNLSGAMTRLHKFREPISQGLGVLLALALGLAIISPALAQGRLEVVINQVDSSQFPQVVSYVTAVDANGIPILALTRDNFSLSEDGTGVGDFEVSPVVNREAPLAVALVVDVSGSMKEKPLSDAKTATSTFIDRLGEGDQANLIAFASQVNQVVDFTSQKATLKGAVASLTAQGDTALYDALYAAVQSLLRLDITRRIVVLMTDGKNTKSQRPLDEGLELARQRGVAVFTVGLGDDINRQELTHISQASGGISLFAPSSEDLTRTYQLIADQLRNQYRFSYTSPRPGAGERRLGIRLRYQGAEATAETTFTPTANLPTPTAVPPATGHTLPHWLRSLLPSPAQAPWYGALGLGLALLVFALVKSNLLVRGRLGRKVCPVCGTVYLGAERCPVCRLEAASFDQERRLGDILVSYELLTQGQLEKALALSRSWGKRLGEVLVEEGLIDPPTLRRALYYQQTSATLAARKKLLAEEKSLPALSLRAFVPYIFALLFAVSLIGVALFNLLGK